MLEAVRASAPEGYRAAAIEGGQWPNTGRGPNMWTNFTRDATGLDTGAECTRLIAWAKGVGASSFMDGNDGANPMIAFEGHEVAAQHMCKRILDWPMRSTTPIGGTTFILAGNFIDKDTNSEWPITFEINGGIDPVSGSSALRPWVNAFVASAFE